VIRDFKICRFCRIKKNVVITSKLNFFQITGIFLACFGCFLPANATNTDRWNIEISLNHFYAIFKVSRPVVIETETRPKTRPAQLRKLEGTNHQHKFAAGPQKSIWFWCGDFIVAWNKSWNDNCLFKVELLQHFLQLRKLALVARKALQPAGRMLCRSVKPSRPRLAKMGLETSLETETKSPRLHHW